jgi:hypothetical protein
MKPDAADLLDAVALFLSKELTPSIEDRRLAFRVRIAAYLVGMVGREVRADLPEQDIEALLAVIRGGNADENTHAEVMERLRAELAVVQPKFDTALGVEE